MSDVKRYGLEYSPEAEGDYLAENKNGPWVMHSDYAALRARLAEVEKERDDAVIKRAAWELESKMARAEVARLTTDLEIARRAAAPMGCVCPPTSEIMCGAPLCPRKGLQGFSVMAAVIDKDAKT